MASSVKARTVGRPKGKPNRPHPVYGLEEALQVAQTIQDRASGMPVDKLTLAELLDVTPSGEKFRNLVMASRAYGLTEGGKSATEFSLTRNGEAASGADEVARDEALKNAVLNIPHFKTFLEDFDGKKVPATTVMRSYMVGTAQVPEEWAEESVERVLADARFAGMLREVKGADYVAVGGGGTRAVLERVRADEEEADDDAGSEEGLDPQAPDDEPARERHVVSTPDGEARQQRDAPTKPEPPKKVFVAHGKNRAPLQTLKDNLTKLKVPFAVAIDEPHAGRPISAKVANLMRDECSSAIFIFTADERFLKEDEDGTTQEVWRPSENVVYELGAASILYGNRIVIFKEKRVSFPSDFSDLGYIEFETDQFAHEMGSLVGELVALDILEIRAKG